jgi:hypothetical protein
MTRETPVSIRTWLRTILLAVGVLGTIGGSDAAWAEDVQEVVSTARSQGGSVSPADQGQASDSGAPAQGFTSSRNIEDKVREQRQTRQAIFDFGMRDALLRLDDEIYRATRLRFAAAYTVLY